MTDPQQQRITRWLLILGLLLVGLILAGLLWPTPDDSNSEQAIAGTGNGTLTPTQSPLPARTSSLGVGDPTTETPFPTITNPPASAISPTPEKNCTYPVAYWRNHPEAWLAENILIGELTYTKDDAIEVLEAETPDIPSNVLKQLFATILNIIRGSDPASIENTVMTGIEWLGQHAPGDRLSEDDQLTGHALIDSLEKYNTGQAGPELCSDAPRTPTPVPTDTITPTPTRTPTSPITFGPSRTPTATNEPHEPSPPTDTEAPPTEPAPTEPPATEPPPPPPTEPPPPPPTERPTPTEAPTAPPA
jgi:hypothetical protein